MSLVEGCLERYFKEPGPCCVGENVIVQCFRIKEQNKHLCASTSDGVTKYPTIISAVPPPKECQIIRLKTFSFLPTKRYLRIFQYEVISDCDDIIGNPVYHEFYSIERQQQQQQQRTIQREEKPMTSNYLNNQEPIDLSPPIQKQQKKSRIGFVNISDITKGMGTSSTFTICALVKSKTVITIRETVSYPLSYFAMELADNSDPKNNVIKATVFGSERCDQLYDLFDIGRSYFIELEYYSIKDKNERYNRTKHTCELSFNSLVNVLEADPNFQLSSRLTNIFDFKSIEKLGQTPPSTPKDLCFVNVVGCITKISPITLTDTFEKRDVRKLTISIRDSSNFSINMVFWEDYAENYFKQLKIGDILVITNAKLVKFSGHSLSFTRDSYLVINPDWIPQYHQLKQWISINQDTPLLSSLTLSNPLSITINESNATRIKTQDLLQENLIDYPYNLYIITGSVRMRRGSVAQSSNIGTFYYLGCRFCFRKSVHVPGAICCEQFTTYEYIWSIPCEISDDTGSFNIDIYNNQATEILGPFSNYKGMDAQELTKTIDHLFDFDAAVLVSYIESHRNNGKSFTVHSMEIIEEYIKEPLNELNVSHNDELGWDGRLNDF